jgi:hypothetical protein
MFVDQKITYACAALLLAAGCTIKTTDSEHDGGGVAPATGGATTVGEGGAAGKATGGTGSTGGTGGTAGSGGKNQTSSGGVSDDDASDGAGDTPSSGGVPVDHDAAAMTYDDACGMTEPRPNDTRDTATPFTLGTSVRACLQNYGDHDFYEFTIPDSPAQGGSVAVSITKVDTGGSVEVAVQTVVDNGTLTGAVGWHGDDGQDVYFWLNGAPGAKFRIDVHYYLSSTNTRYLLAMNYTGAPDANEPNDTRQTATPISVGQPVTGYFFSGYQSATEMTPWDDWFKVTLPDGMATVSLSNLPADVGGNIELQDGTGKTLGNVQSPAAGSDATVTRTVTAGDYYVHVTPGGQRIQGGGQKIPSYVTTPYTLTVHP